MTATTPLQIDGKTYPLFSLNLAITGKYQADGSSDAQVDAQVAMRLIPTRVENGVIHTADDSYIGISLGTLNGADSATQAAVGAIQSALQTYISTKGL